jgi:hypothetical protein
MNVLPPLMRIMACLDVHYRPCCARHIAGLSGFLSRDGPDRWGAVNRFDTIHSKAHACKRRLFIAGPGSAGAWPVVAEAPQLPGCGVARM